MKHCVLAASMLLSTTAVVFGQQVPELKERVTLRGHALLDSQSVDAVRRLAFSPGGKLLVTTGADKTIRAWDTDTGKELDILRGHPGDVWSVSFSPDGKLLASTGSDRAIRLWDMDSQKEKAVLGKHSQPVHALAFSPDGKTLASASNYEMTARPLPEVLSVLKLWDVAQLTERASVESRRWLVGLVFAPDSKTLLWIDDSGVVRLSDASTLRQRGTLETRDMQNHRDSWTTMRNVFSMDLTPDGKTLILRGHCYGSFPGNNGGIQLWDLAERRVLCTSRRSLDMHYAAVSPSANLVVFKSAFIEVSELSGGKLLGTIRSIDEQLSHLCFSPDGRTLVTVCRSGTIKLWDVPKLVDTK